MDSLLMSLLLFNRECPAQFENRIKPRLYIRHITRSTTCMYEKAPFC